MLSRRFSLDLRQRCLIIGRVLGGGSTATRNTTSKAASFRSHSVTHQRLLDPGGETRTEARDPSACTL